VLEMRIGGRECRGEYSPRSTCLGDGDDDDESQNEVVRLDRCKTVSRSSSGRGASEETILRDIARCVGIFSKIRFKTRGFIRFPYVMINCHTRARARARARQNYNSGILHHCYRVISISRNCINRVKGKTLVLISIKETRYGRIRVRTASRSIGTYPFRDLNLPLPSPR